mgnify:FL=1
MSKRKTLEEFIKEAKDAHGDFQQNPIAFE